ncbi:hypothetical protein PDE_05666 [Penicillium oxalicum 114-2]|uniref:MYND-type domain-containing protein n=1 Tax=Penicillium oxalicum (strain 114-2 / CGMCC 5302) TaxID=933388 RepID=S7ZK88_PENO1|nr:hypothetical protein PDE_05666 [Penicillium oxalicum 114-2]
MSTFKLRCANSRIQECPNEGTYACASCKLVKYCSRKCQLGHWPAHKAECKDAVGQISWEPAWVADQREPHFFTSEDQPWGLRKRLWSRFPAFDILKLAENEGVTHSQDLQLLFSACGDLGNVVQTLASLPDSWNQGIELTINDADVDCIGRSVVMLLVAMCIDNVNDAVDSMIHIWYSAFIRKSDADMLQSRITPMIRRVCNTIKDQDPNKLYAKTWKRDTFSVKVILKQKSWMDLLGIFDRLGQIKHDAASNSRLKVTMAPHRQDFRDELMMKMPIAQRLAHQKYLLDGLVLPFGHPREEFSEANPFLYRPPCVWQLNDALNPIFGWPLEDVLETPGAASENDVYGKLLNYLRGRLRSCISRMSISPTAFVLYQMNPFRLLEVLDLGYFDRIDATGITDRDPDNPLSALSTYIPLLKDTKRNPCATLILFFETAVKSCISDGFITEEVEQNPRVIEILGRLLPPRMSSFVWEPALLIFSQAISLLISYDEVFIEYLNQRGFEAASKALGAGLKDSNTIISEFPYQVDPQPENQEPFNKLMMRLRESVDGKEVYLEWRREVQSEDRPSDSRGGG